MTSIAAPAIPTFVIGIDEDLGNGLRAGFVLENDSPTDSGILGRDDRLFDRNARLFLS